MPRRKHATRVNAQNISIANQKRIERKQSESIQCHPKKLKQFAAQTVSLDSESTPLASNLCLDPELTDFCQCLHIMPAIREFHDDDDDDAGLNLIPDQSSDIDIEDKAAESELKRFTHALQMAQIAALKKENKKK